MALDMSPLEDLEHGKALALLLYKSLFEDLELYKALVLELALIVAVGEVATARQYALACSKLCSEGRVLLHCSSVLVR